MWEYGHRGKCLRVGLDDEFDAELVAGLVAELVAGLVAELAVLDRLKIDS